MQYDDTFNNTHAFAIDIRHWDPRHREFWTGRLGRRYLLTVVPQRSRMGRILEIGAGWYNRYQKEVVGRENELTVIDIKKACHPEITEILDLDRYIRFDMTVNSAGNQLIGCDAPEDLEGYFDEIRSWGVLSHYRFSREQCGNYLNNVHRFLKPLGQAIFKLDIDTHKVVKQLPGAGLDFIEALIRDRFTIIYTDVLVGKTAGFVHYVEKRAV
jgi:hypothetical protein